MNLPISQFYHVSTDGSDPYHVYGGLQDNSSWVAIRRIRGGVSNSRWENMFGGDGSGCSKTTSDPNYILGRGARRRNRAGEPLLARNSLDQAIAQLWREEIALQLERADSHESQ